MTGAVIQARLDQHSVNKEKPKVDRTHCIDQEQCKEKGESIKHNVLRQVLKHGFLLRRRLQVIYWMVSAQVPSVELRRKGWVWNKNGAG